MMDILTLRDKYPSGVRRYDKWRLTPPLTDDSGWWLNNNSFCNDVKTWTHITRHALCRLPVKHYYADCMHANLKH